MKNDRKALDFLFENGTERFRRNVPAGQTRSPRRNDDVNLRVGDPFFQARDNFIYIVQDDQACDKIVTRVGNALCQHISGGVIRAGTRVRYRHDRYVERNEGLRVVYRHGRDLTTIV